MFLGLPDQDLLQFHHEDLARASARHQSGLGPHRVVAVVVVVVVKAAPASLFGDEGLENLVEVVVSGGFDGVAQKDHLRLFLVTSGLLVGLRRCLDRCFRLRFGLVALEDVDLRHALFETADDSVQLSLERNIYVRFCSFLHLS